METVRKCVFSYYTFWLQTLQICVKDH
jgi:hypothetical protein